MKFIKITSIIFALLIVVVLVFYLFGEGRSLEESNNDSITKREKLEIGEAGSTHDHATLLLVVNGKAINFLNDKYMLKDNKVHFEDANGFVIHKHADGITLPYFFDTLGLSLTNDCIVLNTGRQYCSSELTGNTLRIIINGVEVENIEYYEIKHEDKILINYGNDTDLIIKFKFNSVRSLPVDFQ